MVSNIFDYYIMRKCEIWIENLSVSSIIFLSYLCHHFKQYKSQPNERRQFLEVLLLMSMCPTNTNPNLRGRIARCSAWKQSLFCCSLCCTYSSCVQVTTISKTPLSSTNWKCRLD